MKKIPTLFLRDFENNPKCVTREINPECHWVIDGEGVATYKWDGTSVLVEDGVLWKRREIKPGKQPPEGFRQEGDVDQNTGKRIGWMKCDHNDAGDRWHFEAFQQENFENGTYELVGPKVQGNPHGLEAHKLIPHGERTIDAPRDFEALKKWMLETEHDIGFEGIVWWHPNGRRAKLKKRDFG